MYKNEAVSYSQSLVCESNSGGFALAHLLGLAQAELFKSALLVYALLLQPSECEFWVLLNNLYIFSLLSSSFNHQAKYR